MREAFGLDRLMRDSNAYVCGSVGDLRNNERHRSMIAIWGEKPGSWKLERRATRSDRSTVFLDDGVRRANRDGKSVAQACG